jgi:putative transposase
MPRSRYRISDTHHPHFLTCTVVDWLPIFGSPPIAQIVLDSWRFLQESSRIELYAYVVMENHVHWIAASDDLPKEVGDFKSFTARAIIDWLQEQRAHHILEKLAGQKRAHKTDREYQFWQEGSHPQMIASDAMMRQKVEYIHENPVKRGYVDAPVHWRYSSARDYAGQPGLLRVTTAW